MRIHGYCETCHKIKRVRVSNAAMVKLAMNQPIYGLCGECEAAELTAAKNRHPSRRWVQGV